MTPEGRAKALGDALHAAVRTGRTINLEEPDWEVQWRKIVASAIAAAERQARLAALEEAAGVAHSFSEWINADAGRGELYRTAARVNAAVKQITEAIRALAAKEGGHE